MKRYTYMLEGLHCANCAGKIGAALRELDEVSAADVLIPDFKLVMEAEELPDWVRRIQEIVDHIEGGVTVVPEDHHHHEAHSEACTDACCDGSCCEAEAEGPETEKKIRLDLLRGLPHNRRFLVCLAGAILVIPLLFLELTANQLRLAALPAALVLGLPLAIEAVRRIRKGIFLDENLLMLLACVGAFAAGETLEGLAVLLFYQIGELCQELATAGAKRSLHAVRDLRPKRARLIEEDGCVELVEPEAVPVGALLEVHPGEVVPIDGQVCETDALVSLQNLTGESEPRPYAVGETLSSGALVLERSIRLRTDREADESTLTKLVRLAETSALRKAPTERFLTSFAKIYTPVVVALAALTAFLPPLLFSADWQYWLHQGLLFLVLSCPCALVLSIPLTYMAGMGRGARAGVLVKGGLALDALAKTEILALDKTGTLTTGELKLDEIILAVPPEEPGGEGVLHERFLRYAASLEQESSHPLAKALLEAAAAEGIKLEPAGPIRIKEMLGKGVRGMVRGEEWTLGRPELYAPDLLSYTQHMEKTTLVLCCENKAYALFVFSDQMRPEAPEVIQYLIKQGIEPVMLSGDKRAVVAALSEKLNISGWESQLLPEQKVMILDRLLERSAHVGFVGDGVNDAPSLARATVGIAMGQHGAEAALESADVVLMQDNLKSLGFAFRLAYRTRKVAWQNLVLSLGTKVVILVLGFIWLLPLWVAVFGDVGIALLAVLHAMHLLHKKESHI